MVGGKQKLHVTIFEQEPEHACLGSIPVESRDVFISHLVVFTDTAHDQAVALQQGRREGCETAIVLVVMSNRGIMNEHS